MKAEPDFYLCTNGHQPIYFNKTLICPLCNAVDLMNFHAKNSRKINDQYQTLYQTALEFSPEILL